MRRTSIHGSLVALLLALAACSTEPATTPGVDDEDVNDVIAQPDAEDDAVGTLDTVDPPEDIGGIDTGDTGATADTCVDDEDCFSGVCVRTAPGAPQGVCTELCTDDSSCPEGWDCQLIGASGTDADRICVPGDVCVDNDEDEYGFGRLCAGIDCDDDDPLNNPAAEERCDGLDNDCDQIIDENPVEVGEDCETGFSGDCARGSYLCEGGILTCDPFTAPEVEICDGIDNDCDLAIDEADDGELLARPCYTGDAGTENVGVCVGGTSTCFGGDFEGCDGEVVPDDELCDGLDNDCDGGVDEGEPESGYPCEGDGGGACTSGLTGCDGGEIVCVVTGEPQPEICDGIDNDCDDAIDEDDAGQPLSEYCYEGTAGTEGVGVCRGGTRTCVDGEFGNCEGQVIPTAELCDALDNDCDERTDEFESGGVIECELGDADTEACGMCGTMTRTCDSLTCAFTEFGACEGQGVCTPDMVDSRPCGNCGTQTRVCSSTCVWGDWTDCSGEGVCEAGTDETISCGLCGSQTRTCTDSCAWTDYTTCAGEGICVPGSRDDRPCGDCGTEYRTCGLDCQYASWEGCTGEGVCTPGEPDEQPCGFCGTAARTCNDSCGWNPFGGCVGEGVCSPGSETSSGCANSCQTRTCTGSCEYPDACTGCSGCSTYNSCEFSCAADHHIRRRDSVLSTCGSGFRTQIQCEPNCGSSFTSCEFSCPDGYYISRRDQSFDCATSGFGNYIQCSLVQGNSFTSCESSCPSGYTTTSTGQNFDCAVSGFGNYRVCTRI